ncbi:MAG: phosphomannomutase/phosphoglucomutase, partial [Proteobacteria bacterium]
AALVRGLIRAGAHVIDVGIGPTPMLYFSVHHLDADGGIMITGSHNPGNENGFKMMKGKASFFGADIVTLRDRIAAGDLGKDGPGQLESIDVRTQYLDAMTRDIVIRDKGMKLVLDAGNGSGGPLGLEALRAVGLSPDPLFCDIDGTFPNHHPDPTVPKNLEALIARVRETGAKLGLAFDGDADRLGAVDADGTIVWGDKLLILFSRALLAKRPGATVIGEVKCSQTLYDDVAAHGGVPLMWKTGHSLIKTKMKETGALLAGEMSGHLFFADRYFGYDDALYASLRLIEILSEEGKGMAELLADVPETFTTPEIRVDCPDEGKFAVVKGVLERYRARVGQDCVPMPFAVDDTDGARIQFGRPGAPAWGLVRASNTGPILVLRFEAPTVGDLAVIRADVENAVAEERAKLGI